MCTVTNVQFHSVFVKLDEYGKSGMIHISEISPGRIRNIRDFVVEGKKIVCKVLRINLERGHIDLSLRRVTENQKKNKVNQLKREQLAEKIVEYAAKQKNIKLEELYSSLISKISKEYGSLYGFFEEASKDLTLLEKIGIKEDTAKALGEVIKQRIKEPEVHVGGKLKLTSYDPDGINIIKDVLAKAEKAGKEKTELIYLGGGSYQVSVKGHDYKEAEKILEKVTNGAIEGIKKQGGQGSFAKQEA